MEGPIINYPKDKYGQDTHFFRTPTESNRLANTNGGKTTQNTEVKRLGTCERVESEAAREILDSPSFKETNAGNPVGNRQRGNSRQRSSSILNTPPNFHIANIQNILAKKKDGKKCK